ncbi:type II secretion system F family protein [Nocardia terpenica]|uniref:Type II secretion system protein GspF domain-containing protein n=1 Tax=Nocardia terpenica TaxID=455432 RepID=A0A164HNM1_9NOCA|nr:type II secretion system F family protein [Nocardia terpenica]KZM68665.1 hypothetical protein AWN90_12605 [Nocardia terpenica]NQE88343.1 type II secretion system F family protein [Nocardia terpenica]
MNGPPMALLLLAIALTIVPPGVTPLRRLVAVPGGHGKRTTLSRKGIRQDALATASTLDLLAACLRAGLPAATAARAVAAVGPGALGAGLRRAADLLALGADPDAAWQHVAPDAAAPELHALVRLVRRSARSGASLAEAVSELAEQCRHAVEDAAVARAERAGVLIAGPLGLCFLPAFVCLGIVPVVVGLAGRVLGGGLL